MYTKTQAKLVNTVSNIQHMLSLYVIIANTKSLSNINEHILY